MSKLNVLSLFSGIGSPEKALTNIGVDYELVGFSEIDKYAIKSYCSIHSVEENLNLGDITKIDIDNLLSFDLVTHGSPCQDYSLAGKQQGGDKDSGTRSSLMWNTVEIIARKKPKYVIWENVKNVLSKKHKHNFDKYIDELEKLGYNNYYKVLNAKNFGIPQHRERIFVVSIRKDIDKGFDFPEEKELKLRLRNMLEESVDEKYYLKDTKDFFIKNSFDMESKGNGFRFSPHVKENANVACCITTRAGARMDDNFIIDIESDKEKFEFSTKNDEIKLTRLGGVFDTEKSKHQAGSVWDSEGLCPTLDTMQGGWRQPCIIPSQFKIRKLTPKECWRLMGFDDKDIEKCIKAKISNTQLYKQAGNSIVVDILEEIFKELLKEYINA